MSEPVEATSESEKRRFALLEWLFVGAMIAFLIGAMVSGKNRKNPAMPDFESEDFAALPALLNGRMKPMDTIARSSLLIISGKQRLKLDGGGKLAAIWWLLEVLYDAPSADQRQVFLIDNAEVLSLINQQQGERKHFSLAEIRPHLAEIDRQSALAASVEAQLRSPFQAQVLKLQRAAGLYSRLQFSLQSPSAVSSAAELNGFMEMVEPGMEAAALEERGEAHDSELLAEMSRRAAALFEQAERAWFFPVPPPSAGGDWRKVGQAVLQGVDEGGVPEAAMAYAELGDAYRSGDAAKFAQVSRDLRESLDSSYPRIMRKASFEHGFNRFAPFYRSMVLYVIAFLLACFFWLLGSPGLCRAGMSALLLALAVHLCGLLSRMYIEGRPPVTNLYSSAVFVGLGAVILGAVLERLFRNGIGTATASIIGFLTLLIAHHLSLAGDTMEMMRAVLDSNLWLATHVVVVTLGYAATFLAGTLSLIYILRRFIFGHLDPATGKSLGRMVYGIVCFATLFSFVGTILGGIWADQSWGRFWGWDPKENGALLIVIWNAIILHARWGGMVRERGLMVLAVFGNIVTSWSWFGTNMLGVGLHAYGFTDAAFLWLTIFVVSQLVFIGVGIWGREWRSRQGAEILSTA